MDVADEVCRAGGAARARGAWTIDGDWLRLTRDGLLQVDRLVHEFFLPEHRTARYA